MADQDRLFLLKRFLYDRSNPGSSIGNSNYSYRFRRNYEDNVVGPHDFLCYGCDEGRDGYVINVKRRLGDIEVHEYACSGCMKSLDSIRLFSIPFVQLDSHEGSIIWAVSTSDFVEHRDLLTFDPHDIDTQEKEDYVEFQFSDGGYDDVLLVKALLRAGSDNYKELNRNIHEKLKLVQDLGR
jgi:hypothetical protein